MIKLKISDIFILLYYYIYYQTYLVASVKLHILFKLKNTPKAKFEVKMKGQM